MFAVMTYVHILKSSLKSLSGQHSCTHRLRNARCCVYLRFTGLQPAVRLRPALWTVDHTSSTTCRHLLGFYTGSKVNTAWWQRHMGVEITCLHWWQTQPLVVLLIWYRLAVYRAFVAWIYHSTIFRRFSMLIYLNWIRLCFLHLWNLLPRTLTECRSFFCGSYLWSP